MMEFALTVGLVLVLTVLLTRAFISPVGYRLERVRGEWRIRELLPFGLGTRWMGVTCDAGVESIWSTDSEGYAREALARRLEELRRRQSEDVQGEWQGAPRD